MFTSCTTISRRKSKCNSNAVQLLISNSLICRYCNRVFDPSSPKTSSIFLTLLRIYLQPGVSSTTKSPMSPTLPPPATLLQPALQLISRHSRRLDATETLMLLPPLVQARDVKEFLIESLRMPRFDTRVIREIAKARRDEVATRLMILEERKVKVVDSRMCVFDTHLHYHFPTPLHPSLPILGPEGVSAAPSHFPPRNIVCPPFDFSILLMFASAITIVAHNVTSESGTIASSRFTLPGRFPFPLSSPDPTPFSA